MEFTIRPAVHSDFYAAEALTRDAFWNVYKPGCDEHYYLHLLRSSAAFLPTLEFVAEQRGELVGHIAYARSEIKTSDGLLDTVTFGPVCSLPRFQGIGTALIRHTLRLARKQGHTAVIIMGDPRYYGRFGFHCGERYGITLADGKYFPGLLALELQPDALRQASGRFRERFVFDPDLEQLELFDRGFPAKEKALAESQRSFQFMCSLMYEVDPYGSV